MRGARLVERMGRGWPGRGEEADDARGDSAGHYVGVGAKWGMDEGNGAQMNRWVGVPPATRCSAKPREQIQDRAKIYITPNTNQFNLFFGPRTPSVFAFRFDSSSNNCVSPLALNPPRKDVADIEDVAYVEDATVHQHQREEATVVQKLSK